MVVGSCASMAYGEPRMTQDIDIVVDLQPSQLLALCEAFPLPEFYVSKEAAASAIEHQSQFNVIHPDPGNKIDFIVPKDDPWSREQVNRRQRIRMLEQLEGFAARPEDIIIGKMIFYQEGGSEKHLRDIEGIFDDLNPQTRAMWAYPDGTAFDADRNTREFAAVMPVWRKRGLISFTINLEGGSPQGYSKEQPWHNSAFTETGELRPVYMGRLEKLLDRADELGMAPIVGFFYFGQAPRLQAEAAVVKAAENATDWLVAKGYTNVLIEIANESNQRSYADVIKPKRGGELIELVSQRAP